MNDSLQDMAATIAAGTPFPETSATTAQIESFNAIASIVDIFALGPYHRHR